MLSNSSAVVIGVSDLLNSLFYSIHIFIYGVTRCKN